MSDFSSFFSDFLTIFAGFLWSPPMRYVTASCVLFLLVRIIFMIMTGPRPYDKF